MLEENNTTGALPENDQIYYIVKVNGQQFGDRHVSPVLAEQAVVQFLNEEQKAQATIVPVTADGKQVLMG